MYAFMLLVTAISIAGVAGYFSVYGLAHIFAGTFLSVIIMGAVLEVGKLVAASYLHRFWSNISWIMRTYLFVAILGLMAITSAGIFGYLSNAYQQDIIGVKEVAARIELLDTEMQQLQARDKEINEDISRIGSNYVTARQNLIKQYAPEREVINNRVVEIRNEQLTLSTAQLEVEAHTGPIIYIAKAMGKGIDEAVLWMICLIIFVFDPLAVALVICATSLYKKNATEPIPEKEEVHVNSLTDNVSMEEVDEKTVDDVIEQPIVENVNSEENMHSEQYKDERARLAALADQEDLIMNLTQDLHAMEDEAIAIQEQLSNKDLEIAQLKAAVHALEHSQPPKQQPRVQSPAYIEPKNYSKWE